MLKKVPEFRIAGGLSMLLFKVTGFIGITTPWRTIYLHPDWYHDLTLRRHETAHLGQMDRDGWFVFWVQCLTWYVWYGHDKSPYEVEARSAENDPAHPLLQGYVTL